MNETLSSGRILIDLLLGALLGEAHRRSANGASTWIMVSRFSFLLIAGFLKAIHNNTRVFCASISGSRAKIVAVTPIALPLLFCSLCSPKGIETLHLFNPSVCPFTLTERGLPVSPMCSSLHSVQVMRYERLCSHLLYCTGRS